MSLPESQASEVFDHSTDGDARRGNALAFLMAMGLFIGQSPHFFEVMRQLAAEADAARRGEDD